MLIGGFPKDLSDLGREKGHLDLAGGCGQRRRGLDDQLRLVPQIADGAEESIDVDLVRPVTNVEAIVGHVDPDLLNTWKPSQGFLDPVGSPESGDAFGLHEALDANRDLLLARLFGPGIRRAGQQTERQPH